MNGRKPWPPAVASLCDIESKAALMRRNNGILH
jgi:hypothetical protein